MADTFTEQPEDVLRAMREDRNPTLAYLYRTYRAEFIQYCKVYQLTEADLVDAFQDAIIAFYENVASGRLQELRSSTKTYLFAIGKNVVFNKLRARKRQLPLEVELADHLVDEDLMWQRIQLDHQQYAMGTALDRLGGKCRQLLLLFYYDRNSIEAITAKMGYSSDNATKVSKSRCMQQLRQIYQDMQGTTP